MKASKYLIEAIFKTGLPHHAHADNEADLQATISRLMTSEALEIRVYTMTEVYTPKMLWEKKDAKV